MSDMPPLAVRVVNVAEYKAAQMEAVKRHYFPHGLQQIETKDRHEPKAGFIYPTISHAEIFDHGGSVVVRTLMADGKVRLVKLSAAQVAALGERK